MFGKQIAFVPLLGACVAALGASANLPSCLVGTPLADRFLLESRTMVSALISRSVGDSVALATDEGTCAAAVTAYNVDAGPLAVAALHVAVIPNRGFLVMQDAGTGRLSTIWWYDPSWNKELGFEP